MREEWIVPRDVFQYRAYWRLDYLWQGQFEECEQCAFALRSVADGRATQGIVRIGSWIDLQERAEKLRLGRSEEIEECKSDLRGSEQDGTGEEVGDDLPE